MVFFCVSVGTMLLLSPVRWLPAKSPTNAMLTLTSLISCTEPNGPLFVTRTICVSALPYWFSPSRMVIASRPFICGVAERAQQERHMHMLSGVEARENHGNHRVKAADPQILEVARCVEIQPVSAGHI